MGTRTPGPWRLDIVPDMGPDGEPYFYINALPGARLGMELPNADCVVDPEGGILIEEDARLIATAPELLAALVGVMKVRGNANRTLKEIAAADMAAFEAIGKATGPR